MSNGVPFDKNVEWDSIDFLFLILFLPLLLFVCSSSSSSSDVLGEVPTTASALSDIAGLLT